MRNKGFVDVLAIITSVLCLYYLSFTFVSRNVNAQATEKATSQDGSKNTN